MMKKIIEYLKRFRRKYGVQFSPLWLREELKNLENDINHIKQSFNLSYYLRGIYNRDFCKSEFGQDLFVAEFFNNKPQGIFFEAGAFNGEIFSNTYYLEKTFFWTGILVEPIMKHYKDIPNHRYEDTKCVHAALSEKDNVEIMLSNEGLNSSIENIELSPLKEKAISKTFSSVFEEYRVTHIDYLSLDIEGHELQALKTLDFKKVNITLCGIASKEYKNAKEIHELMLSNNFSFIRRIGLDYFYVNNNYKPTYTIKY